MLSRPEGVHRLCCHSANVADMLAMLQSKKKRPSCSRHTTLLLTPHHAPTHPPHSGFIVFNTVTYPNFLRFIKHIGAEILESDMSFAVTRHGFLDGKEVQGKFEWAGTSLGALFCQWTNVFNPLHWRMVWDIVRFNLQSVESLRTSTGDTQSIGEWLDERGYGQGFRRNYLIVRWFTVELQAMSGRAV